MIFRDDRNQVTSRNAAVIGVGTSLDYTACHADEMRAMYKQRKANEEVLNVQKARGGSIWCDDLQCDSHPSSQNR